MDKKHWEFTGETKTVFRIVLRRIKAAVTFTLKCGIEIKAGKLGGWIEKESNLDDNAWVSGNACVFGDAQVSEDAFVSGNACVSGDARVSEDAFVSGNACVSGDARVFGNAWVSGDARVFGNAWVSGDARVFGNAFVSGNARVLGDAWVLGDARVLGDAWVFGDAQYLLIGKIGSRADFTTFTRNKTGTIYVSCGCFYGTIAEFREKVCETHGNSKHGRVYQAAADLAELQIDTTPIEDECEDDASNEPVDYDIRYNQEPILKTE